MSLRRIVIIQEMLKHAKYVAVLEEQNSTLRAQIAELRAGLATSSTLLEDPASLSSLANTTKAPSLPSPQENILAPEQSNTAPVELPLSSSAINDIATLVWRLDLGDKGEPTFSGPSGNFCIPSSVDTFVARSEARKRPQVLNNMIPIPDACYNLTLKTNLMNLFLTQLNPVHQFIPPSYKLCPELYPFDEPALDILYGSIFAAGALFSTVQEEKNAGKDFEECMDMNSVKACREQPSLHVVQALSIIAWRELSQEHNICASIYISMAGGLAMGLGLHAIGLGALSKSDTSKILLEQEQENRLRTFWSFFFIDRIAATMLGISCVIPWRRVQVPTLHSLLGAEASHDELAFSYSCGLWQLHDQFMDQIYSFEFKALELSQRSRLLLLARAELLAFKQAMPSWLLVPTSTAASIPPRSALFLQMSYQMSLLLIHRPYLGDPPASDSFSLAFTTISSAAIRMTQYIHLFRKHYPTEPACNLPSLGNHKRGKPTVALPFIVHHILTASIMHLLFSTSRAPTQISLARRRLQVCLETLTVLQDEWPVASKAIAQIQELAVQWNVVAALPLKWSFVGKIPQSNPTPILPNSIDVHADPSNPIHNSSDATRHSTITLPERFDPHTITTPEILADSRDSICDPHMFLRHTFDPAHELEPDLYTAPFSIEDGDLSWMGQLDFMLNDDANSSSLWRGSS
ncbi:putative c6 transcription factor protein [Botrytis cinerea BcDW1]|uniref:Putative c6 transcription factor protein n=1 Tax=Botryotinia fuckeliana (strain BcDW1) TaxID=1290391 RepID=M7TWR5_BOTF1|nr:putative c6 transcription factor protein [Botrytis cinerea BcDW1]